MIGRTAMHPDTANVQAEEDVGAAAIGDDMPETEAPGSDASTSEAVEELEPTAVDGENDEAASDSGDARNWRIRFPAVRSLGRPRFRTVTAALTALAIAGLSVAAVLLAIAHRDSGRAGDHDLALLGAVRQEVVNLISPSVKDPAGSADRIAKDATGQWLTEFQGTKDKFVGAINDSKTESVGEILGAGIERHNADGGATVLVTAVSKVTNASGAKDDPRTWRLRIDVVRAGGGYKLSKVEVVP
ncbi:MAG: hypothetical protein JWN03_7910 [Nocardia sp.]|uniref:hypothetical protein n=1 Tax=Nocardia sp. TaxID=1821 RepID=UPI002635A82C|nr:hypothetical protein [Nocardia sp.]MCU1647635.1 hypothetical protein [Nocardia sp.]